MLVLVLVLLSRLCHCLERRLPKTAKRLQDEDDDSERGLRCGAMCRVVN